MAWILFFLCIEISPSLLNLPKFQFRNIRYYYLKKTFIPDPELVFTYRQTNHTRRYKFVGDMYSRIYGVSVEASDYEATYNHQGFRVNSSVPPYDIAVIGDSYIEMGETDASTFTEFLKKESGLTVLNLGRQFYGPYQYLGVFKRYALNENPKYVLLCFFAGNDFNDLHQYEKWKAGGQYYFYEDTDKLSIISRFWIATRDVLRYAKDATKAVLFDTNAYVSIEDISKFGFIQLGNEKVPMFLNYWEREISSEEYLALKSIISELKTISDNRKITFVVVYIPTATQTYAKLYSANSNEIFVERVKSADRNFSLDAVTTICKDVGVHYVNLLPFFESLAAEGYLLYHPFDTHWNAEGRRAAAAFVVYYLKQIQTQADR